jgi:ParB family chromosome partitioning protein
VPIESIVVDVTRNPRRRFRAVNELAASIREHGLLQPLVVGRNGSSEYYLIAGYRRMAALKMLAEASPAQAWSRVPVVIREEDPSQAYVLTLVENLQREDLTAAEESDALGRLIRERHWSTRQVAAAIHRSQAHVSRRLRVYEDKALRTVVIGQRLPVSVAEELLAANEDHRSELAKRAVREHWDQKRARAEARGYTAAFHPLLRRQIHDLKELVANASLSVGEQAQLRQLAEYLLTVLPPTEGV